jgi:hypothetical protein
MDIKVAANKVFTAIKNELSDIKKSNKGKQYKRAMSVYVGWNTLSHSEWDAVNKQYKRAPSTCEILVGCKPVVKDITNEREMSNIFKEVAELLDEQKKAKGWGTLSYQTYEFRTMEMSIYSEPIVVIKTVELPDAPCKEYKALENYLNKYGQKMTETYWGQLTKLNLIPFKLYYVRAGGKRGRLYGEEGDRHYLANRPKACADILAQLRKHRASKDTMICRFGHEEYIDPIDKQHSEYHETECDGEIREYLNIIIKSDKGKVKYETNIY